MQAELDNRSAGLGMAAVPQERAESAARNLSVLRNIKIGTFHIGSSLADILASGV